MHHQDWETVYFTKKKTKNDLPKEAVPKASITNATTSSVTAKPAWKIEQQVDNTDGSPPLNFVSTDTARSIVNGRVAAKLTQKQLAQRLNMQEKDIKDIEGGKAVENKAVLAKIKRVLNI
jgi:ribosome-binding protein aMBF1 (putative translation factor)